MPISTAPNRFRTHSPPSDTFEDFLGVGIGGSQCRADPPHGKRWMSRRLQESPMHSAREGGRSGRGHELRQGDEAGWGAKRMPGLEQTTAGRQTGPSTGSGKLAPEGRGDCDTHPTPLLLDSCRAPLVRCHFGSRGLVVHLDLGRRPGPSTRPRRPVPAAPRDRSLREWCKTGPSARRIRRWFQRKKTREIPPRRC